MARPRSVQAHEDVLAAAEQLFSTRGIDATSMDAIAEHSGVSKATIYKHWPDKDALCLEVMARIHKPAAAVAGSGNVRKDLVAILDREPTAEHREIRERMMPHLMAYAASRPAFGRAWRSRVLEPPRAEITRVIERAIADGVLPPSTDIELAIALLMGPILYGRILKMIDRPAPKHIARAAVDAFLKEYASRIPGPRK
jgi:AcrR family transcriptional regulator